MILAPIAVGCMLNVIIDIGKVLHNSGVLDFPIEPIGKVPFCNPGYDFNSRTDEPCLSVGYSIIGDTKDVNSKKYKRYHDLMEIFAKNNDFEMGTDVRPLTAGN